MKKLIALIMVIGLLFIGCADNKVINSKEVETYGLINKDNLKDPCIHYDLAWGNIVWTVILSETFIMPIYFLGFSLWEPEYAIPNCTRGN